MSRPKVGDLIKLGDKFEDYVQLDGPFAEILIDEQWVRFARDFDLSSWADVQEIVRKGWASNYFGIGDQLICLYDNAPTVFVVIGIDHDTPTDTNLSHSLTLQSKDILVSGMFDNKEPSNSNSDRKNYGNNRYTVSNIRQWLNSTDSSYTFSAQHAADAAPTGAPYTGAGFLYRLDPELVAVLGAVNKKVALNTVTDGGGQDSYSDKAFLLTPAEVGLDSEGVTTGEVVYPYYDGVANAGRIKYLSGTATSWWLSAPYVSSSRSVRRVYTGGTVDINSAYASIGVAPALTIC